MDNEIAFALDMFDRIRALLREGVDERTLREKDAHDWATAGARALRRHTEERGTDDVAAGRRQRL